MPNKRNPNSFSDVAAVLDTILARGGSGKYRLARKGLAVRWRQRAYQLRLILLDLAAQTCVPGQAPSSKYDHIVIRVDPDDPCLLYIETRRPVGQLMIGDEVVPTGPVKDVQPSRLQSDMDRLLDDLA